MKGKGMKGLCLLAQQYKVWDIQKGGEWEIFYDPLKRRVVILQSTHIYAFERYSRAEDSNPIYFCLPSKRNKVEALTISHNDRYIALRNGPLRFDFGPMQESTFKTKESEVSFPSENGWILALTFMKSKHFDLVICFKNKVDLYKYDTIKGNIGKPIKSLSYNYINR